EGGGDWPPSVRSLRYERHKAEEKSGAQCVRKRQKTTVLPEPNQSQTDNSILYNRFNYSLTRFGITLVFLTISKAPATFPVSRLQTPLRL
ncbi:hypothetical protein, partial [Klebsiella aerogenes]